MLKINSKQINHIKACKKRKLNKHIKQITFAALRLRRISKITSKTKTTEAIMPINVPFTELVLVPLMKHKQIRD